MTPDEFQQAWQADSAQTRVIIDADLLREEVQRDQRQFNTMISYRDFGEVGVAIVMIPIWFVMGYMLDLPWAWYLSVPVFLWIAGFMLLYRRRHQPEPDKSEGPLLQQCVQRSLAEAEEQIWLLKNILWWYLLPPTLSITAFFAQISWQSREGGWAPALLFFVLMEGFVLALYGWIYVLNQRVVREQLLPRREELQKLRTSLEQETTDEGINGQIALPNLPFPGKIPPAPCASPVQLIVGLVLFLAIILLLFFFIYQAKHWDSGSSQHFPKRAPFAAVRWEDSQPEVKVNDEWYRLIALDGIPAEEMITFSKETFGDKWQKRFEEDLVELMSRMGHPPGSTVTLEVQLLSSSEKQTLKEVRMTIANRAAIWLAAQARERDAAGK
ncbi:UbiA prenyltransferase family protein [Gimesia panareensis]|uniref:Uncharacterized protein n=1 Tax=Gimesia panareensis TaxID=2527978 RepID=A0A517QGE6_9PLAN|nr:hypothetical protein [Gimesia panareensis]QDT30709.1 hypothetical protein Enr10x_60770 [Gimesia panareensis]QDU53759.1 hypothetical protein Pan110_61530 [Gimesia panareensis]